MQGFLHFMRAPGSTGFQTMLPAALYDPGAVRLTLRSLSELRFPPSPDLSRLDWL